MGHGKGLPPTEHAMYIKAVEIEADTNAEVLAMWSSYFDRTWETCSHRQTPIGEGGPAGYSAEWRCSLFCPSSIYTL